MSERITFTAPFWLKDAIEAYTNTVGMSMSSYLKKLVGDDLIEKGYLKPLEAQYD